MSIVSPAVFANTITPTALNAIKTIDPGANVAPWSNGLSGLGGANALVGPGVYEAQIDTRLMEALGAGDTATFNALMNVRPGGPLEVVQQVLISSVPSVPVLALDPLVVQYAAQWQIIQTALASARSGAFYSYDCEIDRLDVGIASPIAQGTTVLTASTQALFTISNPGSFSVLLSFRNFLNGDVFDGWITKNVLSSGPQQTAGNIVLSPTGAPTVGVNISLAQLQGIVIQNSGVFNVKMSTLGAGHGGTYPSIDWRIDQLDD